MNYSQNNEQHVIGQYFGAHVGTFLDLGANDGRTLSNTRALVEKGWSGVCVEPDRAAFRKLIDEHRENEKIQCIPIAVGNEDGVATFYEAGDHLGRGDTGLLSSLKESNFDRFPGTFRTAVNVDVWKVATLLTQAPIKKFDFVSIDVEEMDLDIFRQMDLKAMGTSLVCIEFNGIQEAEYTVHASKYGMKLLHRNNENLIFAL